jgi:predicted PurR-regulated permease PerM
MTGSEGGPRGRGDLPRRASDELVSQASIAMTILVIIGVAVFLYLIRSILLPFVLTGILAYVCTPLVDWAALRTGLPRWLWAMAVLLAFMAFAGFIGYLGIPAVLREITTVGGDLQSTLEGLVRELIGDKTIQVLGQSFDARTIAADAVSGLKEWFKNANWVLTAAALSFAGIFGFILMWVLLGYFLLDAPRMAKGLLWLIPPSHRPFAERVWVQLDPVLRRYFVGVAIIVIYAAIVAYAGLGLILGIHHAILLALLTGLLEVIPIVGPAASALLAGMVAVQQATSAWNILAYALYAMLLRISIDQFFGPIVLGRAARVRPILIIFCFLAGGILFGIVGIVLAVPVAITLKVILATLYNEPDMAAPEQGRVPDRDAEGPIGPSSRSS